MDNVFSFRDQLIEEYPMNALANSQLEELEKFLHGYEPGHQPFTVARYTGQESEEVRQAIADAPPDILLTNFMMLELILTRFEDKDHRIIEHCHGLEFLVLDELHTYRGRQGADVALLVRRLRERVKASELICIGTSATMSSTGTLADRNQTVATVASTLFGTKISSDAVIGETLERVTNPSLAIPAIRAKLADVLRTRSFSWADFSTFRDDPLAIWVELSLGLDLPSESGYVRARPMTLREAGERLATDAECDEALARQGLQAFLIAAHEVKTPHGRMPFAFKLHQFISGPGKVLSTLEAPEHRQITLDAQRFAPGRQEQGVQLYPVHFCRDCGQEYHPVWRSDQGGVSFSPREIDDLTSEDNDEVRFGFLCPTRGGQVYGGQLEDLPDTWLDYSKAQPRLKMEAMATLQAALKRGIELTFQIEESELIAEPLPKQDDRKGILFYEAAEGGAGVLTRLANEPASLALAASNALQLMHFDPPDGPWDLARLDALEHRDEQGNRPCEAGCYQCLLSYYNQPDHESINRRDPDALRLLVALANAQVTRPRPAPPTPPTGASTEGRLGDWLEAIDRHGLSRPDATAVPIQQGAAVAAAQYKGARALVFLQPLSAEISTLLTDKGWRLLDFSDPASWDDQFAQHPDVFGVSA